MLLILLLAVAATSSLQAGLKWDRTVIETRAAPSAKEIEAEFVFKNTGDRPVRITRVATSCGCTTTRTAKDVFAPGESGNITARFEFGDRRGLQQKRITVRTDDPDQPETQLGLVVTIEESVELDRTVLLWRRGDPVEAKSVAVTPLTQDPVKVTGTEVKGEGFAASVRELEAGRSYSVVVTPAATDAPAAALIAVRIQRYGAEPETVMVRARVK